MERSVALETGKMISVAVLPAKIGHQGHAAPAHVENGNGHQRIPEGGLDLEKYVQDLEKNYILAALDASEGVGTRAAELLKMSYRSFRHYSKKYSIR
jgi:two-component system response regulator PilR (NtrC family)